MRELTYIRAIREALVQEMQKDEKVFLLGESIQGGVYEHTAGLVQEFGTERVMDTPIAETAIAGAGIGSALMGYRPVIDFMFGDFMYVAMDEILFKAAQAHFLHGGRVNVPMVMLAAVGGGMMLANEHSKTPISIILHHPGLKLAIPSTPADAKGLLTTAIRDDNPVVFFWHKMLMSDEGDVPEGEYTVPFGVADIKRAGSDVTVVAHSWGLQQALEVAAELVGSISVEVVDPRTLEPFDLETVLKSVEKTNRLVIVDEDTERCGFAGELTAQVVEHGFDLLDAPIMRVCGANCPLPGVYLEQYALPQPEDIQKAIEAVVA